MSQFVLPRHREVDSSGNVLAGGKYNFYAEGTSNRQNTYPTQADAAAGTNANANPVVADGDGIFGAMYLSDTLGYKVVLTDSADVVQWTEDNWDGSQSVALSSSTRLKQIASTPLDYRSAVGDGVADEYLAVQDAIDNASRVVDLLGKTFRCDSALTMAAGLTFQNGTLDFTNSTATEYFKIQGSVGSYTALTGNAAYLADLIAATSVSGFAASDMLNIISSGTYCADGVQGELAQIRNISTLNVYLTNEILDAYTTANTARAAEVTTVDNVVLKNLTILTNKAVATANTRIISCHATKGLRMYNVNISGVKNQAILLAGCSDTILDGCTFEDGAATTSTGILVEEATQDLTVRGCTFRHMAISIDTDTTLSLSTVPIGVRRRLNIVGNTFEQSETNFGVAMHIGQDSQYVRIEDNHIIGGDTGAQVDIDCADVEFMDNRIDSGGGDGVSAAIFVPSNTGRGYRAAFVNNTIRGADGDIAYSSGAVAGTAGVLDQLLITDNKLDQGQISVAAAATGADVESILITDNNVQNMVLAGTNVTMGDCLIDGNRIGGAVASLVSVTEIDRITISDNKIRGDGSTAANGINCPMVAGTTELNIHNNSITNFTTRGIVTTDSAGTTAVNITGNSIKDTGAATVAGISVDDAPRGSISNNVISSYTDGINLTNTATSFDGFVMSGNQITAGAGGNGNGIKLAPTIAGNLGLAINGNTVDLTNSGASRYCLDITGRVADFTINGNSFNRDNDTDDNINLSGTGSADITRGRIIGNTLVNGAYGILGANCSGVVEQLNNFFGMGTSDTSGTIGSRVIMVGESGSNQTAATGTGDGSGHGGHFTGGATGSAAHLTPQAEPTGAAGDIYTNNVTNLPVAHDGNVWAGLMGVVYAGINAADVRTTDGAFAQLWDLPANSLRAGQVLKISAWGTNSALSAGTGDPYINIEVGGNVVAVTDATTNLSGGEDFYLNAFVIVRSIGNPGSLSGGGHGSIEQSADLSFDSAIVFAPNTEAAIRIDVNVTGLAASGDTMRLDGLIVEVSG